LKYKHFIPIVRNILYAIQSDDELQSGNCSNNFLRHTGVVVVVDVVVVVGGGDDGVMHVQVQVPPAEVISVANVELAATTVCWEEDAGFVVVTGVVERVEAVEVGPTVEDGTDGANVPFVGFCWAIWAKIELF
jgi:hypothetical protein